MLFINSATEKVIQHDTRESAEENHSKEEELVETAHTHMPSIFLTILPLAANTSKKNEEQAARDTIVGRM